MYNTLAPCPAPELAVRFSFRPGTGQAILLGGPAPSRHRRGRLRGTLGTFVRALTGPGRARESVAHQNTPGVLEHPQGGSGTLVREGVPAMSRIAPNGRAGNSAPATHDHDGSPWRRQAQARANRTLARVVVRHDVYGTSDEAGGPFQQGMGDQLIKGLPKPTKGGQR